MPESGSALGGWGIAGVLAAIAVAVVTVLRAWHDFKQPIKRWWGPWVEARREGLHRLTLNASAIQVREERLRELVDLRPLIQRIIRNPPRDQDRPCFELEGMMVQALLDLQSLGIETFVDDSRDDEATKESVGRFFDNLLVACDRRSLRLAEKAWGDAKRAVKA